MSAAERADMMIAKTATENLRSSGEMIWASVRDRLASLGIPPSDAAVGMYFPGSPGHDGYLLARQGRYFRFTVIDLPEPDLTPADLLYSWEELGVQEAQESFGEWFKPAQALLEHDTSES
jgi:hypothetical protein